MSKSEIPNKINMDYFKIGIEVGTVYSARVQTVRSSIFVDRPCGYGKSY